MARSNEDIRNWAKETASIARNNIRSSGTGKLSQSVIPRFRSFEGEIDRVSYEFNYYGIFYSLGVGKGSPIDKRSPARKQQPWLNPALDIQVPKLADIVAEDKADTIVKGIII